MRFTTFTAYLCVSVAAVGLGGCREGEVNIDKELAIVWARANADSPPYPVTAEERKIYEKLYSMDARDFLDKARFYFSRELKDQLAPCELTRDSGDDLRCDALDVSLYLRSHVLVTVHSFLDPERTKAVNQALEVAWLHFFDRDRNAPLTAKELASFEYLHSIPDFAFLDYAMPYAMSILFNAAGTDSHLKSLFFTQKRNIASWRSFRLWDHIRERVATNHLQVVWDLFHSESPITAGQLKSCRALHALTKGEFTKFAIPFAMARDREKFGDAEYTRMSVEDKQDSAALHVGTLWQLVESVVHQKATTPPTAAAARGGAVAVDG